MYHHRKTYLMSSVHVAKIAMHVDVHEGHWVVSPCASSISAGKGMTKPYMTEQTPLQRKDMYMRTSV
jgi:hypothetical protein